MAEEVVAAAVLVGGLLLASKMGEEFAERLGYPGFAGSIIAGILLSPAVLGVATPTLLHPALILFILGINFTLFLAGVEELSNPALLKPTARDITAAAIILAIPSVLVTLPLVFLKDIEMTDAFAFGVTLSLVSAGPLMKLLMSRGSLDARAASILRVGLLVEIGGLILFNALVQGFSAVKLVETTLFIFLVYLVGRHYLDEILIAIEKHMHVKEAPFAIVVALVTMTGYLAEMLGFNAAVTALFLGVFLSEYMERRPLYMERIKAFTFGFLEPLFFIGIGVYAVRPSLESLTYTAMLLGLTALPKLFISKQLLGTTLRDATLLLAKGGVDAALLLALLSDGRLSSELYTAGLLALIASTLVSSTLHRIEFREAELYRKRLADIDLDMDIVAADASAEYAARVVSSKGAAVVVDKYMRPIGYVTAEDFVGIDKAMLSRIPVRFFMRSEVPIATYDTPLAEIIGDHSLLREPIIAVVNEKGEVVGTITPRKILSMLISSEQEKSRKRVEQLMDHAVGE